MAGVSAQSSDTSAEKDDEVATWSSLPQKGQLAILLYARFTEPLSQTAFSSYMYYQLASFDSNLSDKEIAIQAGLLSAVFAIGSCITAIIWGRLSQFPATGRKTVVVAGLAIACISCIGIGFATRFSQILAFQLIGGIASGNVGVIRAIVPEIIPVKSFHARAFSLLPMCTTFGAITGPFLAGVLIEPAEDYSALCGENTLRCRWVDRWPFALPMIVNAVLVLLAILLVIFAFEETLPRQPQKTGSWHRTISILLGRPNPSYSYRLLPPGADHGPCLGSSPTDPGQRRLSGAQKSLAEKDLESSEKRSGKEAAEPSRPSQSISAISLKIAAKLVMSLHFTAYATAISVFLPAPLGVGVNAAGERSQSHGLGFSVKEIGVVTMAVTILGIPIQLLLFPRLHDATGSLNCLQLLIPSSTVTYLGFMFLAQPPESSLLRWLFAATLMALHVVCRTICQPSALLMINDISDNSKSRAKIHSITHSCDSAVSAVGLIVGGALIHAGIQTHFAGLAWLIIACLSLLNSIILRYCPP